MAKKKTRKQKILADKRHVLYHLETPSAQESETIPSVLPAYQTQAPRVQALTSYAYVIADIKKTALITGAIVSVQVILFFLLNRA